MKKFHVGCKGVIRRDSDVLLLRPNGAGPEWDLPGGRIEGDESMQQALRRELDEELPGIAAVRIGNQLGCARVRDFAGKLGLVLVLFEVEAELPDPIRLSHEHSASEWIAIPRAAEMLSDLCTILEPLVAGR